IFLKFIGPPGHIKDERAIDSLGLSLGAMLADRDVDVRVNGIDLKDWQPYVPLTNDRVEVISSGGPPPAFLIPYIISLVISMALSQIVKALTPKPKKPKLDSNRIE